MQDTTAAGQPTMVQPQAGQFVFAKSRYAAVWIPQVVRRAPSAKAWEPTSAEKIAHFESVVANSGSYEVSGSRVTLRPVVAKMPEFAGGYLTYEFRIEGDELTLEAVDEKSADNITPPNYEKNREKLRLRRVADR